MAIVQPTPSHEGRILRFVWVLAAGDTGSAVKWMEYADRSVQVAGTFGGASVSIEGTNDGDNWISLTDPQGNAISASSAKIEQVLEATWQIRPKVTGGDGTTALTVSMVARLS